MESEARRSYKQLGFLGSFRQEIDCLSTLFHGFWPFNAKIWVTSGEEYWGPLGKDIVAA